MDSRKRSSVDVSDATQPSAKRARLSQDLPTEANPCIHSLEETAARPSEAPPVSSEAPPLFSWSWQQAREVYARNSRSVRRGSSDGEDNESSSDDDSDDERVVEVSDREDSSSSDDSDDDEEETVEERRVEADANSEPLFWCRMCGQTMTGAQFNYQMSFREYHAKRCKACRSPFARSPLSLPRAPVRRRRLVCAPYTPRPVETEERKNLLVTLAERRRHWEAMLRAGFQDPYIDNTVPGPVPADQTASGLSTIDPSALGFEPVVVDSRAGQTGQAQPSEQQDLESDISSLLDLLPEELAEPQESQESWPLQTPVDPESSIRSDHVVRTLADFDYLSDNALMEWPSTAGDTQETEDWLMSIIGE